jgi:hypothetical protein
LKRQRILKASRDKQGITYKGSLTVSADFSSETLEKKVVGQYTQSAKRPTLLTKNLQQKHSSKIWGN